MLLIERWGAVFVGLAVFAWLVWLVICTNPGWLLLMWELIQLWYCDMREYTPGYWASPQPIPKLTTPIPTQTEPSLLTRAPPESP